MGARSSSARPSIGPRLFCHRVPLDPIHGFALQALGSGGTTIGELGRRLGVSKQAAAKTAASLEAVGCAARQRGPAASTFTFCYDGKAVSKVSRKHQITLPVRVLREARIASGDEVVVRATAPGHITIERADEVVSRFAGSLPPGTYPPGYLDQLRDEWPR